MGYHLLQLKRSSLVCPQRQGRTIPNSTPKPSAGSSRVTGSRSPCPCVCSWEVEDWELIWGLPIPRRHTELGDAEGLTHGLLTKAFLQTAGKATFDTLCSASVNLMLSSRGKEMCFQVVPFILSQIPAHAPLSLLIHHFWIISCTEALIVLPQGSTEIRGGWQGADFGGPRFAWRLLFNLEKESVRSPSLRHPCLLW